MQYQTNINLLLLRSIPLDRHLKRYYLAKYCHLCKNNGVDFANAKFKDLLSALKQYKSSGSLPSVGLRRNGWMKKLISYTDTHPHFVFNFLKGFTSWQLKIDVKKASRDFDLALKSVKSDYAVPRYLKEWIEILNLTFDDRSLIYKSARLSRVHLFHRYCSSHSKREWNIYWRQWHWILKKYRRSSSIVGDRPVFPEMYKDFSDNSSQSYEDDINRILYLIFISPILSVTSKTYIRNSLNPILCDEFLNRNFGGNEPQSLISSRLDRSYVGDIHYIPKSGTSSRPIAVPNRFIQSALTPIYERLDFVVKRLNHDATYDQDKFNTWISSRTRTDSRFIGSVDLSSATENLPLEWIRPFLNSLELTEEEKISLQLFNEVSRANWNNYGSLSKWTIGQPLGSLPSFSILALTHNLFCESLSLRHGYGHSPYRILGDDIVIGSKRVYNSYIQEMTKRRIPLSHSKCYSGKFTEFAGQCFIRKGYPFMTPDHRLVTWESLFDFQYSTGIKIPWNLLPKNIRNKFTRYSNGKDLSGHTLYLATQFNCMINRGSTQINGKSIDWQVLGYFQALSEESELQPEGILHTGITRFLNGTLIINDNKRPVGNGMFRRYIETTLPVWFKRKFRPVSTDKVISNTIEALEKLEVITAL
jgi:hypothetical protein